MALRPALASLDHWYDVDVGGRSTRVLRMPYVSQKRKEALCFVFSVEMCLDYFVHFFPDPRVRARTKLLSVEEIIDLTSTRVDTGTTLAQASLGKLSEKVQGIEFQDVLDSDLDKLKKRLSANLPSIIIYNGSYYDRSDIGPAHAGVLIGMLDDDPIFNNPWFGRHNLMNRLKLERSWEIELNRAVLPSPTHEQTRLEVMHDTPSATG